MLIVPGGRPMTFREITPTRYVNDETGVEVRMREKPLNGLDRWYVYSPVNDSKPLALRLDAEAAMRYARLFVVVEMRNLIAEAYDEATAEAAARG